MNTTQVALVGSGETAKRVAEMLKRRADIEISGCFSDYAAGAVSVLGQPYLQPDSDVILASSCLTLLCTKDQIAMDLVPRLLQSTNHRCIDISGAYRLLWEDRQFQQIYGFPHTDLGRSSVYGLPELQNESALRDARLIATAGTVSTAALLAIVPLAIHGTISPTDRLWIEASCGASAFAKCDRVAGGIDRSDRRMERDSGARHTPEICHGFRYLTGHDLNLECLCIEMTQWRRGVEARIHFGGAEASQWVDAQRLYQEFYPPAGLVRVAAHEHVDGQHLIDTHVCELSPDRDTAELTVIARLDNLGKGGPGQLVQNLNIALGRDPLHGLR